MAGTPRFILNWEAWAISRNSWLPPRRTASRDAGGDNNITWDLKTSAGETTTLAEYVAKMPEERPYGVDSAFRDPSGNALRLTEVRPVADWNGG